MVEQVSENIIENKPFFLRILCIAIFVYSGILAFIMLFGLLYAQWLTDVMNDFLHERSFERQSIIVFCIAGLVLYIVSFIGGLYLWNMKRKGYYIFLATTIIIMTAPYFFGLKNFTSTIIYLVFLLILSLFYKKFS